MIRYYIADIKELPDPKTELSSMKGLPDDRQKKCLWYIRADDRKRCLGAGKIIKRIFDDFNVSAGITYGVNGKPECEDIFFNISHSESYVIGVASTTSIGCDIEYIADAPLEIADNYFHNSEVKYIQESLNKSQAFWKLWTLKESYMKMTGEGMDISLDGFCVVPESPIAVFRMGVRQKCNLEHFEINGYSIAICVNDDMESFDKDVSWIKIK